MAKYFTWPFFYLIIISVIIIKNLKIFLCNGKCVIKCRQFGKLYIKYYNILEMKKENQNAVNSYLENWGLI